MFKIIAVLALLTSFSTMAADRFSFGISIGGGTTYETREERVLVREGYWAENRIPAVYNVVVVNGVSTHVCVANERIERVWIQPQYEVRYVQVPVYYAPAPVYVRPAYPIYRPTYYCPPARHHVHFEYRSGRR